MPNPTDLALLAPWPQLTPERAAEWLTDFHRDALHVAGVCVGEERARFVGEAARAALGLLLADLGELAAACGRVLATGEPVALRQDPSERDADRMRDPDGSPGLRSWLSTRSLPSVRCFSPRWSAWSATARRSPPPPERGASRRRG